MNINELNQIKESLPKGYRHTLKKVTGYSLNHIDNVLAGRRQNQSIVNAAIDLLEEYVHSREEVSNRLKNALNRINPRSN